MVTDRAVREKLRETADHLSNQSRELAQRKGKPGKPSTQINRINNIASIALILSDEATVVESNTPTVQMPLEKIIEIFGGNAPTEDTIRQYLLRLAALTGYRLDVGNYVANPLPNIE